MRPAKRSRKIPATFAATSMPTSSSSAIGPIGIPKSSIAASDAAMLDFGMPMGPMALLDEVGIDVAAKVAKILGAAFGDRGEASIVVEKLYADGRHGKKNGKGLYLYENGKRQG